MNSLQRKLRSFYLYAKQCVATRENKSFWRGKQVAYREIQKWNEVKEVNDWIPVEKRYPMFVTYFGILVVKNLLTISDMPKMVV